MSVRTMARVWEHSRHSGTHLLMLLAVADFADDDGNAYPSIGTLAQKCRMKPRNAQVIMAALRQSGELEVRENEGPRGTNLYRITVPQGVQSLAGVQRIAGVQRFAPGGAKVCAEPLQRIAPEPSLNHQEPSVREQARSSSKVEDKRKTRPKQITLAAFLEACRSNGEQAIPEGDPIFAYAGKAGISDEMLAACWHEFKAAYLPTRKQQADWRAHYRNAVRRNWYKLWYLRDGELAAWTTAGEQARRDAA